jgi:hypothetical protein
MRHAHRRKRGVRYFDRIRKEPFFQPVERVFQPGYGNLKYPCTASSQYQKIHAIQASQLN